MRNPHQPYIDAVIDAMPAGFTPTDWWASHAETGLDGETATLSAVISWNGHVAPELYPNGLILCWDLDREWQYAGMRPDGQNDPPNDLPLPLWALPADVAKSAQALLSGEPLPRGEGQWSNPDVMAAVQEWVES